MEYMFLDAFLFLFFHHLLYAVSWGESEAAVILLVSNFIGFDSPSCHQSLTSSFLFRNKVHVLRTPCIERLRDPWLYRYKVSSKEVIYIFDINGKLTLN